MQIEQIYTGCLAQGAYYITSNGEAAIIDPLREIQPYLDRLERDKVSLKYIFETHFHADFVSGHVDLAKATNAKIVYGPTAKPEFEAIVAADEQVFEIGKIKIKVLHTPGHTMESTTFLLIDENGKDHAIFSGDTLFIGDVGRPDLAQKAASMTQEELAATLFHSLRNKIMTLADEVIVYPAHGAGSACGKNMSKETVSTVGNQKATNYALRANMTEAEFIKEVTDGLLPPPAYFGMNVAMNKKGYESFETVLNHGMRAIPVAQLELMVEETRALILDTRNNGEFAQGFIPQSINIGIDGDFAPWVGALIADVKQPIMLVTPNGREEETVTRLSRVGFDNLIGHLESKIIDIRKESEYEAEHIEDAYSKPLAYINEWVKDINPEEHFFLHCAGGYRSMIAASILEARGFRNFSEVEGGFNAIAKTTVPKTNFVCQSKVLK
jgi:hydroxyacylglutathione hydrolase